MFWSECGLIPRIVRASLSGLERSVLVETGLTWPIGLVVDAADEGRLYWVDKIGASVSSVSLTGQQRRKHLLMIGALFFGIALYQVIQH